MNSKFSYVTKGDEIREFTGIHKNYCEWCTAFERLLLWPCVFLSSVNGCVCNYCEKFPYNKNWDSIIPYLALIKLNEYSKGVELQIQCEKNIINTRHKNEIFIWVCTHACVYLILKISVEWKHWKQKSYQFKKIIFELWFSCSFRNIL